MEVTATQGSRSPVLPKPTAVPASALRLCRVVETGGRLPLCHPLACPHPPGTPEPHGRGLLAERWWQGHCPVAAVPPPWPSQGSPK